MLNNKIYNVIAAGIIILIIYSMFFTVMVDNYCNLKNKIEQRNSEILKVLGE